MKKLAIDYRLITGLIIAHILMYITFHDKAIFWYMFTATMLLLISFSLMNEKTNDETSLMTHSMYGIFSGIILFALFWVGNLLIDFFHLPFQREISILYQRLSPTEIWHYAVLFLIIVPGEELFWRGFIQKRLSESFGVMYSIILAAALYASVHIYSGYFIHLFSALFAGIFWGALYAWKKSMRLVLVSHFIFDLFMFVLLPLR